MGKKQHQKDKLYLTCTEWSTIYGGKRPRGQDDGKDGKAEFRRLPFDHCSLSLQPFETPYCDDKGNIFDLVALLPFLKKFKVNPITGLKTDPKSLIKLNFHKDNEGKFQCPVLFKTFTNNSHIVAVKTTGNVFCNEAIEELNVKYQNWRELLTDEPFTRADIITIQDPNDLQKFNLEKFHHVKNNLKIKDEELEKARHDPAARIKTLAYETQNVMQELERDYKPRVTEEKIVAKADIVNAAHYSTGKVAASFTSTSMPIFTVHEAAIREEDSVRYERIKKKKGYVRLITSCGTLNFELHTDLAPKACENFILLCKRGYYNGTKFHRSIRHFMIQGGDPTGKGKGGESAWGTPFKDEIVGHIHHQGRGILSMANSGPDSNNSQFFITFRSCKHLDGKHTIFGKLVGGLETLSAMEKIEVDNKDRPIEDIVIIKATVFVDPYEEVDEALASERAAAAPSTVVVQKKPENKVLKVFTDGPGKYIDLAKRKMKDGSTANASDGGGPKKKTAYSFGNFDKW